MNISELATQYGIAEEDLPEILSDRAVESYERYDDSGDAQDIRNAVVFAKAAVRLTPDGHPEVASRLNLLGVVLETQYELTGDLPTLHAAIDAARRAVSLSSATDESRAARLSNLGNMLESLFEETSLASHLEEAIDVTQQALSSLQDEDAEEEKGSILNNLANKLEQRYKIAGATTDIDGAVQAMREAIRSAPDDESVATLYNNLGTQLATRYEALGDVKDLEEAITAGKEATRVIPANHPDELVFMSNLGLRLNTRYERLGNSGDLDEAIRLGSRVVEAAAPESPERHVYLMNLANQLGNRFERQGDISDLEQAIVLAREAMLLLPETHYQWASWSNNLANKLERRYEASGLISDLEEAISISRKMVEATPESHVRYPDWVMYLGNKLLRYSEQTGSILALDEAVAAARRSAGMTVADRPHTASLLTDLGIILAGRFGRTNNMSDLEDAIKADRRALQLVAKDHPARPAILHNLGTSLAERSECEHPYNTDILNEAIEILRGSAALTPPGNFNGPRRLNSLGTCLHRRYQLCGDMTDLDDSIRLSEEAIASTTAGHPDQSPFKRTLGAALLCRHGVTGRSGDMEAATAAFYEAWSTLGAVPPQRIKAGAHCVKLLAKQGRRKEAAKVGVDILALLPAVLGRLLDRNDEQHVLAVFSGVAADLCSILLAEGRTEDALLHMERGRAVIISQLLDHRRDMAALEGAHPEIAREYRRLVALVNSPLDRANNGAMEDWMLERRRGDMEDLTRCIARVRSLQGHAQAPAHQSPAEMRECARGGTIVAVNVTEIGSHAILVSRGGIRAIALPKLSHRDVASWSAKAGMLGDTRNAAAYASWLRDVSPSVITSTTRDGKLLGLPRNRDSPDGLTGFLSRLWLYCVRPILEELGYYHGETAEDLPRIWWLGSGLASSIPFHAAGDPSTESTENTMSWVVSSYTSTIKALRQAGWTAQRAAASGEHKMLLVTMPKTPGLADLPAVEDEARAIHGAVRGRHPIETIRQPSKAAVLQRLPSSSIAHFACHGCPDPFNPLASHMALQGSSSSSLSPPTEPEPGPEPERLLVQEIVDAGPLDRPWLAYLSSCSTARSDVAELVDEGLHLASGFQVAGFGHVVAALWPSRDSVCAQVAGLFYEGLMAALGCGGGGDVTKEERAPANALHYAVKKVWEEHANAPHLWAPYIHFGP